MSGNNAPSDLYGLVYNFLQSNQLHRAAKALEKATAQEGKAAVVFQEKKVAATKEKEEADEQHTKATEKLRIAEEAKERATKEREDCVKAQARLEKEVGTTACTRLVSLGCVVTPMALACR